MEKNEHPGLDIDIDMRLQRLEWRLQRIAWVIFYGFLLALVLGLLGKGVFSRNVIGTEAGALRMSYERFLRHRTADTLYLTLRPQAETVSLLVDRNYIERAGLQTITPQPVKTISQDGALIFVFAATPHVPVKVELDIRSEEVGTLAGWIGLPGQERLYFSQFVYP